MMKSYLYLILCVSMLWSSCGRSDRSIIQDATKANSPYSTLDSLKGLQVQARYLPPELMALKESKDKTASSDEYKKLKREFSEQLMFKVNLKWNDDIDFL